MRILLFTYFSMLIAFSGVSQEHTFNIKKESQTIYINTQYASLFRNALHPFRYTLSNQDTAGYKLNLIGGEVIEKDSGLFLKPMAIPEVLLEIIDPEGNVVYTKQYPVRPEPQAMIAGARTDSVLLDMILLTNRIYAKSANLKPFRVKSFEVIYGDRIRKLKGDKLKGQARIDISNLPEGSLIEFRNIIIEVFDALELEIAPYFVTMNRVNPLKSTRLELNYQGEDNRFED